MRRGLVDGLCPVVPAPRPMAAMDGHSSIWPVGADCRTALWFQRFGVGVRTWRTSSLLEGEVDRRKQRLPLSGRSCSSRTFSKAGAGGLDLAGGR